MKKYIKTAFVAAIVGVTGYNVYQSNHSVMNNLSDFALANVEALAQSENNSGAKNVITTDLGREFRCIDGVLYDILKYRMSCLGSGNLPCQEGTYERRSYAGICRIA